nr:unnamed protein product [Digitaria exilis]
MRAPPPAPLPRAPRLRRRSLPLPRGGSHCPHFARCAARSTRCSYSREGNGEPRSSKLRRESSGTDRESLLFQGTNLRNDQRKGDIQELFSQAQRNILYLNKQRLLAMEELKKLQDENKLLLQEIQVLETEVQGVPFEAVQSSRFGKGNLVEVILPNLCHIYILIITSKAIMLIALLQMYSPPNFLLRCSTSSGVGLILIEPTQLSYFNRDMLRGYPDDFERV